MTETLHEDWPLNSPYGTAYKQHMDSFREGLWKHLETVPTLDPQTQEAVLQYLLSLSCQAQNIANISLGRKALLSLPRDWLLQTVEQAAQPLLELEDEWEYQRLLEVCQHLDQALSHRIAVRGLVSPNRDIREAARSILNLPD